jgi:hypothetical protein
MFDFGGTKPFKDYTIFILILQKKKKKIYIYIYIYIIQKQIQNIFLLFLLCKINKVSILSDKTRSKIIGEKNTFFYL